MRTVAGFKRFESTPFTLAPLTVLTGLNGSGKTSLLQALLLTKEAAASASPSLRLNGPFGLELGTAGDIQNWRSSPPIRIGVEDAAVGECVWTFGVPSDEARRACAMPTGCARPSRPWHSTC